MLCTKESSQTMATADRALRILIVDDEPLVSMSIKLLLRADGHEVTITDSPAAALDIVGASPFDLLITDFTMADMNGDDLAAAIKERFPALPVIMVTAFAESLTYPLLGVDVLIGKPFSREDLRQAVQKAIR